MSLQFTVVNNTFFRKFARRRKFFARRIILPQKNRSRSSFECKFARRVLPQVRSRKAYYRAKNLKQLSVGTVFTGKTIYPANLILEL